MNLTDSIVNAFAPDLSTQIADAKTTAQQVAGAVTGWAIVIAVELGILIFLVARKRNVL
jgi:hypothetical protein